jgi:hypothetical protein
MGAWPREVAIADFDGDGDLDLASPDTGFPHLHLRFNTTPSAFTTGDANRDGVFNQLDIFHVLQAAKYMTGEPATWGEGDWNSDGTFDQFDIVAAMQTGRYLPST